MNFSKLLLTFIYFIYLFVVWRRWSICKRRLLNVLNSIQFNSLNFFQARLTLATTVESAPLCSTYCPSNETLSHFPECHHGDHFFALQHPVCFKGPLCISYWDCSSCLQQAAFHTAASPVHPFAAASCAPDKNCSSRSVCWYTNRCMV